MEKGQITLEDINFGIVVTEKQKSNKRENNSKSQKKSIPKVK